MIEYRNFGASLNWNLVIDDWSLFGIWSLDIDHYLRFVFWHLRFKSPGISN